MHGEEPQVDADASACQEASSNAGPTAVTERHSEASMVDREGLCESCPKGATL